MIDPKELRVGNLIKSNGSLPFFEVMYEDFMPISEDPSRYHPIPLTEEWLIKFVFRKQAHSFIGEKFHLSEWDSFPLNWCVAMNKNNSIIVDKLKFVHQLQNLYFALTRQELIYNENHK